MSQPHPYGNQDAHGQPLSYPAPPPFRQHNSGPQDTYNRKQNSYSPPSNYPDSYNAASTPPALRAGTFTPPAPPPHRSPPSHSPVRHNDVGRGAAAGAVGGVVAADTAYHGASSMRGGAGGPDLYDSPFLSAEERRRQGFEPGSSAATPSLGSERNSYYSDNPYNRPMPPGMAAGMAEFDPRDIADDGEDDIATAGNQRRSFLGLGRSGAVAGAAGVGAAGGAAAAMFGNRDASGQYSAVQGGATGRGSGLGGEKSAWMTKQTVGRRRRLKWVVGICIAIVVLIIAGSVTGYLLSRRSSGSDTPGLSASQDEAQNGDLNKNSQEIKDLLNNDNLHRVFPGMDYTPLNTQYPECLTYKPSQNNVTRDMAVLSQLTGRVRLYGTDCNQTEMVLHAIDQLELNSGDNAMKVWLGVWLGNNKTTNTRQVNQMWDILDNHSADPFDGIVVGNEVLFREDLTPTELASELQAVKSGLQKRGINLPVATSDLGSSWTDHPELVQSVDVLMANIHPFFGGVPVDRAASWTNTFFQGNNVPLVQGAGGVKAVISEVGWPSDGGNDKGAVAGVDEMNQFMADWVCQSLTKGTDYFWFEAFDEPWKVKFNTPTEQWEDKWGLMDVNRNLKDGVQIPDCGGQTV